MVAAFGWGLIIAFIIAYFWDYIVAFILVCLALVALYYIGIWIFSFLVLVNWSLIFWVIGFVAVCGLMWRGLLCED